MLDCDNDAVVIADSTEWFYTGYFSTSEMRLTDTTRFNFDQTHQLLIKSSTANDSGIYRCVLIKDSDRFNGTTKYNFTVLSK